MKARVLLIEDNPADARLLRQQLRFSAITQFEWVEARLLGEGLEKLRAGTFDLILLDLSLPDEQGLATLRRTRESAPLVPVVVLTGYADEALAAQALREGAQDYLVKGQTDPSAMERSFRYAMERARSEQALRESEEHYRFLFDNNPHPMWVFDLENHKFLAVNNAAVRHYGYSREEFLSMTLEGIRPPEDIPQLLADLAGGTEEVRRVGTRRHRKRDGTVINVEITSHGLRFAGKPSRLVLANDITERIRLEEQLQQAQKMEAIGRLAGGVAHDFNNLLTVITGYGQMLLNQFDRANPAYGDVQEILNAANRAALLTNQLLAFSRRKVTQAKPIELNNVVGNIQKMLGRLVGENVQMISVLEPGIGRIMADPNQIEQILMNLVVNARDAMPDGGKITLETAAVRLDEEFARTHLGITPGPYVLLAVSDTGRGMTEAVRKQVFEPFFTTKTADKGTGLGLSMVYGIVRQCGGDIYVYSELNKGSVFKLYFPVTGRVENIQEDPVEAPVPRGAGETVLLVEDDTELRTMVERMLTREGFHVLLASSGQDALQAAQLHTGKIALLLTDVVMPGMSGRDLASALAPMRPKMKVLFMSGYTDAAVVHSGELPSGVDFIQKPFRPDALVAKVRAVIDGTHGICA